jgi:hypothetical protein
MSTEVRLLDTWSDPLGITSRSQSGGFDANFPKRCDDAQVVMRQRRERGQGMSSLDASQTNVETLKSAEQEVHVPGELVYEYVPWSRGSSSTGRRRMPCCRARCLQNPRGHGSISISRDLLSVRS